MARPSPRSRPRSAASARGTSRVALASALGPLATAPGHLASLRRKIWLDALSSALLCQALARGRSLAPDVAFSAGLLHDFGKIVAIAALEELIGQRRDVAAQPLEAWTALVDRFHVEAEHDAVGRAIETLPAFVASFESGDAWRPAPAASLVTPPPRPPVHCEAPKPPAFPVQLSLAGKRHEYRILGVASTHLMLSGAAAVPENLLLEMTLAANPPLTTFASVKLAWPEGDRYSLLVQPYALSGDAALRWRDIVAATTAEAA